MPEKEEPMAVAATEAPITSLAELSERLEVPDGYRVEIVDGSIFVSPTPQKSHAKIIRTVRRTIGPVLEKGALDLENVTVEISATGERYIPDLLVFPDSAAPDDEWLLGAEHCLLAVEVTSPNNPEIDRLKKPRGYASAGVPLYLLVDAVHQSVTLFSLPRGNVYHGQSTVDFGEKIHLPEPFDVAIDTAEFP